MQRFDRYLKAKLDNSEFEKHYSENCNICLTVWKIVESAEKSGKSWAEISQETGIEEEELIKFSEADNCQHRIVSKLCDKFKIKSPENCPRFDFDK